MKDFLEIPSLSINSLFLIRNPNSLDLRLLEIIKNKFNRGQIISFERLFKGNQSALVVFGPKELVSLTDLDLLELEDFTNVNPEKTTAWEVTYKGEIPANIFADLPPLKSTEQFWWQISLQIKKDQFRSQIRAVLVSERSELVKPLQNLSNGKLIKKPRPLTSAQILDNFKKRTILPLGENLVGLDTTQILKLIGRV